MALHLLPGLISGLKLLLIPIIQAVFVYFLYQVLMMYSDTIAKWAFEQIASGVNYSDATVQLTGLAAWFAENLRLGQILAMFLSFLMVRFVIGMVRG